ncbi:MAG TPA: cell division protein SepF [Miltoncostaeales bacterium]|jgi:cell division inhibitor SepF|nr:cell division protein SepF [Miltoncostaeales bacterium]
MALSDMWHKTLVYFGLAGDDEEDFYPEEEETRRAPARQPRAAEEELEQTYRERPNVRRIGSRRRDEFDDIFSDDQPVGPAARSTPIRAVEPARPQQMEVHLVVPKSFNDVQQVADKFKASVPVIVNLQNAEMDLAKRLIDFTSGLTYALNGGMQRVADKVFLLTPRNVEVSAEERARLLEKGFFNQY